ncbi:MAG: flagellar biosynthetic protein FliO, partial [Myxococcota bacterium]
AAEAPETDEASTLADARVADAANDDDAANAPVAALASHRPFPSRPESDDAEATPPVLASASEGTELPYGLLLAITAILGGLHLLMKALAKRGRIPMPEASIDVVASKRLGTRHQLVVVRALGEEHLLSVNGGQLQHLSTAATGAGLSESLADGSAFQALNAVAAPAAPSSVPPPPDANPEPPAFLANVAARLRQGAALAPTGVLPRPQLPEAQSFAVPQPRLGLENVGENVKEDEGADRFGAQLLRLAELREDNAQLGLSEHRPPSAAVAGLLRLRAKAQRG